MKIKETDKNKIINIITALLPDVKIYLFGSQATNTAGQGSDIDIALDAGKPLKRSLTGEVREVLNATDIPLKIDVVDFHFVSKEMKENDRERKGYMEKLIKRKLALEKALSTLKESLDALEAEHYYNYEILRDSIIQRFEYSADTFWKVLKDYLLVVLGVKIEIARPKSVLKECNNTRVITDMEK